MSINDIEKESVQFEQLNDRLSNSLVRCHELVDDCRAKLAANSNELGGLEEDAETLAG